MEIVDILKPPTFEKSGVTKPRDEAWKNHDWIGTFNLWIVQSDPVPSIVYQIRSPQSSWAPNKLDVTAGGHYQAGETLFDGLREVEEELNKHYDKEDLTYLGRKLHVSPDTKGNMRQNVVDISFIVDNSSLDTYQLEKDEVFAVCICPIEDLLTIHRDSGESFTARGLDNKGKVIEVEVTKESFPYNWDDYHHKIALLAQRFVKGEKDLMY